jgi:hypothetical protein
MVLSFWQHIAAKIQIYVAEVDAADRPRMQSA